MCDSVPIDSSLGNDNKRQSHSGASNHAKDQSHVSSVASPLSTDNQHIQISSATTTTDANQSGDVLSTLLSTPSASQKPSNDASKLTFKTAQSVARELPLKLTSSVHMDAILARSPVSPPATGMHALPGVGGGSKMREIRERAKLRRQLVAQQLGVWCPDRLGEALGNTPASGERPRDGGAGPGRAGRFRRHNLHGAGSDMVSLYTDSTTFLKGTQSANPHNDYCQHFVDTGHRPQNFIRDVGLADRFEEYPKLRELIKLKDDLIAATASPPSYLKADLHHFSLSSLRSEFDVILVEPPLEEYQHTAPGHTAALKGFWDWNQIRELDIAQVAAPRSFIFLWVGSSEGLDEGRRCLRSWGFRRCEDICWIRTNSSSPGHSKNLDHKAVFQRTKEHCLMGIKGTVRRSTDGDFIHANVDIDLIITEESGSGTLDKPLEIFHIIEHFCLGKRRLHLFGRDPSIRPGWLTVGPDLSSSNFDPTQYASYFNLKAGGTLTTGCTDRIEALRPKSPPPKPGGKSRGGYARGRGRGR